MLHALPFNSLFHHHDRQLIAIGAVLVGQCFGLHLDILLGGNVFCTQWGRICQTIAINCNKIVTIKLWTFISSSYFLNIFFKLENFYYLIFNCHFENWSILDFILNRWREVFVHLVCGIVVNDTGW